MRALLDSNSDASFIADAKAKSLVLPNIKVQAPIAAVGSTKTQRTSGIIVIRINDAVENNLHVMPKITYVTPTQPIVATQVRQVNILHFADPRFNVPRRIDFLLGAYVLDEAMLDNRIKDNGVIIRESCFDWIVSRAVQKPAFEDKNPNFFNALSVVPSSNTENLFSNFGALESAPDKDYLSQEEKECERLYDPTTEREANGEFAVQMHSNKIVAKIGLSKAVAMKRFSNLEKIFWALRSYTKTRLKLWMNSTTWVTLKRCQNVNYSHKCATIYHITVLWNRIAPQQRTGWFLIQVRKPHLECPWKNVLWQVRNYMRTISTYWFTSASSKFEWVLMWQKLSACLVQWNTSRLP